MDSKKVHRLSPAPDMTPMVDLAFLLIVFFMLTSCVSRQEPAAVDNPTAGTISCGPGVDMLTITVTKEGRVFFDVDGNETRLGLIEQIGKKHNIDFTKQQIDNFLSIAGVGVPVKDLPALLDKDWISRLKTHQQGIPYDSLNNELSDWVAFSKAINPKLRVALNGDQNASYSTVEKVMEALTAHDINHLTLVTRREIRD